MDRSSYMGPHFEQFHRESSFGNLPSRFGAGEAGAKDGDGVFHGNR